MNTAPEMSTGLRPHVSRYRTAGMVARNIATPTTPEARREVVLPAKLRLSKINGASVCDASARGSIIKNFQLRGPREGRGEQRTVENEVDTGPLLEQHD